MSPCKSDRASAVGAATAGPRERLDTLGPAALSDAELLALLLRTGGRGVAVEELARVMLSRHHGVSGLARAAPAELNQGDHRWQARNVKMDTRKSPMS